VIQELTPLLEACVWPRWLLLEAALDEASISGALHLSALLLRTQIEELGALWTVATVLSPTRFHSLDDASFAAAIGTLSGRVLPRVQAKTTEQLIGPATAESCDVRSPALQEAYDQLSEYVHPNYGSHILSVRPQDPEAASVFVEAFVAVYGSFLSLPWAQEVERRPVSQPEKPAELRPAFLVLAEDTVKTLAPALQHERTGPVSWIDAVNCFRDCAEREGDHEAWARSLESGEVPVEGPKLDVEAIRALREHSAPEHTFPEPLATAAERLRYASLVETERRLVEDAERLAPGTGQRDDAPWVSLLCSGLTFSINVTEFKLQSLARQAARLISAENVLGAALAVRSMLEHHAVAIELGRKVKALWERAERSAPNDRLVTDALAEAERQIARVLAGSSGSQERSTPWRTLWDESVRKPYNVLDPIRGLDAAQPGFLKTYGLLSHVVHGTVLTGGDLLGTRAGGAKPGQPTLAQLVMCLASLCETNAMLERQAASMMTAHRLNLARHGPRGLGAHIKATRILEGQKLKPGRDVSGTGTVNDPFRFREGLFYHDAYHHYLEQEGIQVRSRRLELFGGGFGDRVETEDGRVLYFLAGENLPE
jgi:hypothetical protein